MAKKDKTTGRPVDQNEKRSEAERLDQLSWQIFGINSAVEAIAKNLQEVEDPDGHLRKANEGISKARKSISQAQSILRGLLRTKSDTKSSSVWPARKAASVGTGLVSGRRRRPRKNKSPSRVGAKRRTARSNRDIQRLQPGSGVHGKYQCDQSQQHEIPQQKSAHLC